MSVDRASVARVVLAMLIVLPSAYLWERCLSNEATMRAMRHDQSVVAAEQVSRAVAACDALNAVPAAIVKATVEGSPVRLSDRERIGLRAYIEHAVESASRPKVCTVESLHLEPLAKVAAARP